MDVGSTITLIVLYSAYFMAGWGIILVLLWIRPEYMFLLFYLVANHLLVVLFQLPQLTWGDAPDYALRHLEIAVIEVAVGVPVVVLFKWLKTRKTNADRQLDKDIERIRADIVARDVQQPTAQ